MSYSRWSKYSQEIKPFFFKPFSSVSRLFLQYEYINPSFSVDPLTGASEIIATIGSTKGPNG
jgi:hypothetical protein